MLLKIADNLMINTDRIDSVQNNILYMVSGERFKIKEITARNLAKICDANEVILFSQLNSEIKP
jgi:hypothetical protein